MESNAAGWLVGKLPCQTKWPKTRNRSFHELTKYLHITALTVFPWVELVPDVFLSLKDSMESFSFFTLDELVETGELLAVERPPPLPFPTLDES